MSRRFVTCLACLAVLALAGCGKRSFIVPVSTGVYGVSGSSTQIQSGAEEQARILKDADAFCARYGRSTVVIASSASDAKPGTLAEPGSLARASIQFRCD